MTVIRLQFKKGKAQQQFTNVQKQYIKEVTVLLQKTINLDDFKRKVEKYYYKTFFGTKKYSFRMNKGYSRKEIFKIIMSGKDKYENNDSYIDLVLCPYLEDKKYHAFTKSSIKEIYINTIYLDYCMNHQNKIRGLSKMANTLIHEYLHNLGFNHKSNKPSDYNDTTVPYAIGIIVKKLIRK